MDTTIGDHGGSSEHLRDDDLSENEDNTAQTSKSRGAVTVQIFIKKTYKMINDSDPSIAEWTQDGTKFVIKDPDRFANEIIPQYFDHNKFSSFTRQLNFYKFTREQSKVIKKSDQSNDISKHQTFYHKYFQQGRPDLLKHLQRSKKTEHHGDDGGGGHAKRQKVAAVAGIQAHHEPDQPLQQQVYDLLQKSQRMEQKLHVLEQENNKLSLNVQTLQHQDELKQRAILQCEEHIRRLELQMANAFQSMQQMNQPLPFGRESSLSAVNPSALMRYLSMGGSQSSLGSSLSQELQRDLSRGISRLTTPPRAAAGPGLTRITTPPRSQLGQAHHHQQQQQQRQFSAAAAAAENLVANEAATTGGGGPTLGRNPRAKQFGGSSEGDTDGGGGNGPSLPRHPQIKQFGAPAENGMDNPGAGGGAGATLPRHPRMKGQGQFGGAPTPGNFPGGIPTGFNNNTIPNSRGSSNEQQNSNGSNNNGNSDGFDNAVTREESFGISSLLDLARGSSLPV